ncbi:MAG: TonB-dependent receptor [Gemmatimonadetes bacterium]|nr:TonB-dependent receptor [Gemmatimonadota bacterium]
MDVPDGPVHQRHPQVRPDRGIRGRPARRAIERSEPVRNGRLPVSRSVAPVRLQAEVHARTRRRTRGREVLPLGHRFVRNWRAAARQGHAQHSRQRERRAAHGPDRAVEQLVQHERSHQDACRWNGGRTVAQRLTPRPQLLRLGRSCRHRPGARLRAHQQGGPLRHRRNDPVSADGELLHAPHPRLRPGCAGNAQLHAVRLCTGAQGSDQRGPLLEPHVHGRLRRDVLSQALRQASHEPLGRCTGSGGRAGERNRGLARLPWTRSPDGIEWRHLAGCRGAHPRDQCRTVRAERADLNNRYFLTLGARFDGNSAFGQQLGLQMYPKVSGSYVLSDETFWPKQLGTMRLRAAYGQSGRAPAPSTPCTGRRTAGVARRHSSPATWAIRT